MDLDKATTLLEVTNDWDFEPAHWLHFRQPFTSEMDCAPRTMLRQLGTASSQPGELIKSFIGSVDSDFTSGYRLT